MHIWNLLVLSEGYEQEYFKTVVIWVYNESGGILYRSVAVAVSVETMYQVSTQFPRTSPRITE